jgi:transglutaminase-like putative cysteine protease/tetratricopeptide (TPR) repeat protein
MAQGSAPPPSAAAPALPAITVAPTPAWVVDRAVPEATKARLDQAQQGIAYLLADAQTRVLVDGHDGWFRSAIKVVNRSGLESAGQITLQFDPGFETVDINFVHLIRDGKVIDLTQGTRFRVVEREDDLDSGIVRGTLKAVANLADVRVGDIVDYATTSHTQTTLWPNQAFFGFSQRFSESLAFYGIRYLWPAGMEPRYKSINGDFRFGIKRTAKGLEWESIAMDPPVARGENDVPASAFQWGRVAISTMRDWSEVARWAVPLYHGDETLPPAFKERLDRIARSATTPADRLTEATRYLQDEIRYVGEEMGIGSYVPRRPAVVVARGYGDCKDKSLLLTLALRYLNIEAAPALVSTQLGSRLPELLPSPLEFDHVIVRAVVDGKVLWLDPTGAHRGGRGAGIVPSDLGYALPIRSDQAGLEKITGFAEHAGTMTVIERFAVDEAATVPLTLHVETRYTDARADNMRAALAVGSLASFSKSNLEFYQKRFPDLTESAAFEAVDDRDRNVVTLIENYAMAAKAFKDAAIVSKFSTRAYALQGVLPDRQTGKRLHPLALPAHIATEQTIELRVKNRVLDLLDDVKAKGSLDFSRESTRLPDGVRMTYRLNTGSAQVAAPDEAEAIYVASDLIKDETNIDFFLEKAPRAAAGPQGIEPALWAAVKPEVEAALAVAKKGDQASRLEALANLNAALAKIAQPSPLAGLIEGLRGGVLSDLRRPQAALAALQSATAQFDGNPDVYRLWIAFELDLGTAESIAAALERTSRVQPQILASLDKTWVQAAFQKVRTLPSAQRAAARETICMPLERVSFQQQPRTGMGDYVLECAIMAYSARGELAAARSALAKGPSTRTGVRLAIDRRHQMLWPDIDAMATDGFRKSLEREANEAVAAAKAAPSNHALVTQGMQALRALGRFQEALDAGKALAEDKAQIEVAGNDAFWLVNEYALNLLALGRGDEALARMDAVLALGLDRYPELASLAINRSEMLIRARRFQDAATALAGLDTSHPGALSEYGKMWVWANRACALRGLGRVAEAKADEDKVSAKPAENWSAATFAAACRGDVAGVADLLVTRLRDDEARPDALNVFITFKLPEARTPFESELRAVLDKAKASPAVVAEFAKVGRSISLAGTTQSWNDF